MPTDQSDPVAVLREATETFSGIKMGDTGRVVLSRADVDAALAELERRQGREKRLEALVRELGKCRSCNGTGRRLPTCFRCDDSTDDHECPGEVDCYGCAGTGLVEAARKELNHESP